MKVTLGDLVAAVYETADNYCPNMPSVTRAKFVADLFRVGKANFLRPRAASRLLRKLN